MKHFLKIFQILFLLVTLTAYFVIYLFTGGDKDIILAGGRIKSIIGIILFLYAWFLATKPAIMHILNKKIEYNETKLSKHIYNIGWLLVSAVYNFYLFYSNIGLKIKITDIPWLSFIFVMIIVSYILAEKFVKLIIDIKITQN